MMNKLESQMVDIQREAAVAEQKRSDDMASIRAEFGSVRLEIAHLRREMWLAVLASSILTTLAQNAAPWAAGIYGAIRAVNGH